MRYPEDPWEFEHPQVRDGRNEASWVSSVVGDVPDVVIPSLTIVCPQCRGRGVSSLYLGGFTQSEMDEQGPDFYEDYMSGAYDRTCESCNGRNVVEVVDVDRLPDDLRADYEQWMADAYESDALHRAEIRAGA